MIASAVTTLDVFIVNMCMLIFVRLLLNQDRAKREVEMLEFKRSMRDLRKK